MTDEFGVVTDSYTYDAYGTLTASTGTTENNYLYAGEQFDKGLNQYYLRDRYYGTDIGRFTQRDRFEGDLNNPLSLNKYGYTHGNPVNGTDPSGQFLVSEALVLQKEIQKAYGVTLPLWVARGTIVIREASNIALQVVVR